MLSHAFLRRMENTKLIPINWIEEKRSHILDRKYRFWTGYWSYIFGRTMYDMFKVYTSWIEHRTPWTLRFWIFDLQSFPTNHLADRSAFNLKNILVEVFFWEKKLFVPIQQKKNMPLYKITFETKDSKKKNSEKNAKIDEIWNE